MKVLSESRIPVKAWVDHVQLEEQAKEQLLQAANLPFAYKHIAAMPDAHWGNGCCVGAVIATRGAIVPAMVGVDIGCGMVAQMTTLKASDLPDNLAPLRAAIEKAVPHGRTNDGGEGDRGAWFNVPEVVRIAGIQLNSGYQVILARHPELKPRKEPWNHLGTLGTGNHFIELCLDEQQNVWIMLHSGSRGIGNKIGNFFIGKAKEEMERYFIGDYLPNKDLAYLVENSNIFHDYVFAVEWAQRFAQLNRNLMLGAVEGVLRNFFPNHAPLQANVTAINCHHNYIAQEHHFGSNVWVTRKGAVRAREGDYGIIPGSMGTESFIVKGRGNPESFHSCSHGAGRRMGRNEAKRQFTVDDHIKAVKGVECRIDSDVIDETPMAYKSINDVMRSQEDLVEIVYKLKQILNVKG